MRISKRVIALLMVALMCLGILSGCDQQKKEEKGAEVGKWHAVVSMSDIGGDSMSDEDRYMLSMLAGETMFEIDAEFFEDGTFRYEINTDKLEEEISESVNTFLGYFIGIDISLFTDRIVKQALHDTMQGSKTSFYGTYTKEDQLITAVDEETLLFEVTSSYLTEIDSKGNEVVKFTKVE